MLIGDASGGDEASASKFATDGHFDGLEMQSQILYEIAERKSLVDVQFLSKLDGCLSLGGKEKIVYLEEGLGPISREHHVVDVLTQGIELGLGGRASCSRTMYLKQGAEGFEVGYKISTHGHEPDAQIVTGLVAYMLTYLFVQTTIDSIEHLAAVSNEIREILDVYLASVIREVGGKEIAAPVSITCGENSLGVYKGQLRERFEKEECRDIQFMSIYDGRQYSKRILFLKKEKNKNAKVYYDQDKFDAKLREIEVQAGVFVLVSVREQKYKNKTAMHLTGIKVSDAPDIVTPLEATIS